MTAFLIFTLISSLAGIIGFVYFLRKGQFDDMEDVKYQMFQNDENKIEKGD